MLLKPKQKSYRLPTARYRLKNEIPSSMKIQTILTYIHMSTLDQARTPATKRNTDYKYKSPHRILVLLHTRSKYPTQLARWVLMKSSVSQPNVFFKFQLLLLFLLPSDNVSYMIWSDINLTSSILIAIEKPYTTARILENEQWVLSLPAAVPCGWQAQYQ